MRLRGHHWEFLPDHHSLTNCCLVEAIETTAAASGAAGAPSQLGARPKGSDYSNISIDKTQTAELTTCGLGFEEGGELYPLRKQQGLGWGGGGGITLTVTLPVT